MAYFITGATGLIGRHLLALLAARGEPLFVLVRSGSATRLERALAGCGLQRDLVVPVAGDLRLEGLGVASGDRERMRGRIRHFFHLAALYDLDADATSLQQTNVEGTRQAIRLAEDLQAGCVHLASSIAVAGHFRGSFTEQMFSEAVDLDHPYFRTKHESEALVRGCPLPWRIYRPGMVVGHSDTGVMDKTDGPYYLFRPIQKLRALLPPWVTLPPWRGGYINLVPVNYVAAAMNHLAHVSGSDRQCFHLTAEDCRLGEVFNIFARAAHAPTMALDDGEHGGALGVALPWLGAARQPLQRIVSQLLVDLQVPRSAMGLLNYPTTFDATQAQRLLAGTGIRPPALESYAWRLWDFWERELDAGAYPAQRLRHAVAGKQILVTGGSSGIGRATATKLAGAGARVLLVARDPDKLAAVRSEIETQGGSAQTYACDLTDAPAADRFLAQLLADHGYVDILVNNAGRSIRRGIDSAYERLHDYERVMAINYLAAVRVTLALLPSMVRRGGGQVVNLSSIGVLSNAPRFSAYNASKAALEAFSRCAGAEFRSRGVRFTVINMPLVRTPMVAPTRFYEQLRLLEPADAAALVCRAIVERPERLTTALGSLALVVELLAPSLARSIMSESYRLFPESGSSGAEANGPGGEGQHLLSPEMRSLAAVLHGVHW